MAMLEFLVGVARAWVVAARSGHLVDWPSRIVDGFSRRSAASKPVRIDVARGGGGQVNERLISCFDILVSRDQFLQPVPAAFRAVEVDDLEPVRPRFNGFNERSPTQRIERDTLDVAAAALVNDRHGTSFYKIECPILTPASLIKAFDPVRFSGLHGGS